MFCSFQSSAVFLLSSLRQVVDVVKPFGGNLKSFALMPEPT